jgi:hypothetical protein
MEISQKGAAHQLQITTSARVCFRKILQRDFQCCSLKQIPFVLNLPAILLVFYGIGIWLQTRIRPDAWCVRLRGCPPPCGLLLDAASPHTPSAKASEKVDARRLIAHHVSRSWSAVLLQRSGIKEEKLALGQHGGQPR